MTALLRIGTKVRTIDRGARVHGRSPDKPEAIGTIQDHHRPYGRQSKDRTPPYYVAFETGDTAWYDASEVERVRGSAKKSAPQLGEPMPKAHAQLNREIAEVLNKRRFKLVPQPAMSGRAGMYHYGPASIWISGPVGGTWWATARFHYQEKDFDARSLQDVLDQAMHWVDEAPESR